MRSGAPRATAGGCACCGWRSRSTIALALGATALVSWLDPLQVLARLPIDSGKLVISGTKITMEAPKLSGYTRDKRWYEMTAESAAQDITKPDIVELTEVRAKIETADKSTILLSAEDGPVQPQDRHAQSRPRHRAQVVGRLRDASRRSRHRHRQRRGRVRTSRSQVFTQDATLKADRLEVDEVRRCRPLHRRRGDESERPRQAATTAGGERDERERRSRRCAALALGVALMPARDGAARRQQRRPTRCRASQQNRGQPVQIEALALEVRDKDKMATFSGNVKVVQGDTTMRCKSLVVFYEQRARTASRSGGVRPCRPRSPVPAARRRSAARGRAAA